MKESDFLYNLFKYYSTIRVSVGPETPLEESRIVLVSFTVLILRHNCCNRSTIKHLI